MTRKHSFKLYSNIVARLWDTSQFKSILISQELFRVDVDSTRAGACVRAYVFRSTNAWRSPCMAGIGAEVQPERTSRVDPDRPFGRRAGLASLPQPAGKCSASPLLFHTCGTTAARKSLCLEVCVNETKVNSAFRYIWPSHATQHCDYSNCEVQYLYVKISSSFMRLFFIKYNSWTS